MSAPATRPTAVAGCRWCLTITPNSSPWANRMMPPADSREEPIADQQGCQRGDREHRPVMNAAGTSRSRRSRGVRGRRRSRRRQAPASLDHRAPHRRPPRRSRAAPLRRGRPRCRPPRDRGPRRVLPRPQHPRRRSSQPTPSAPVASGSPTPASSRTEGAKTRWPAPARLHRAVDAAHQLVDRGRLPTSTRRLGPPRRPPRPRPRPSRPRRFPRPPGRLRRARLARRRLDRVADLHDGLSTTSSEISASSPATSPPIAISPGCSSSTPMPSIVSSTVVSYQSSSSTSSACPVSSGPPPAPWAASSRPAGRPRASLGLRRPADAGSSHSTSLIGAKNLSRSSNRSSPSRLSPATRPP